jgi:imidazolonepropionase
VEFPEFGTKSVEYGKPDVEMANQVILVRGARQLITLVGPPGPRRGPAMRELCLIQDGAVLIVNGIIREIGPSRRVERLGEARDAFEIDASGKVVMPGFVDCHTRLIGGPLRLDDFEAGSASGAASWRAAVLENVRQVRTYSKQRMELEARKQLRQFVRHGTTTLDARSGYGLDESSELKLLRVIEGLDGRPLSVSASYFAAHTCPEEWEGRREEYIDWVIRQMLPLVKQRRLAGVIDVFCGGEKGFTEEQAGRVLDSAREQGFSVRLETEAGTAGCGAVDLAVRMGAIAIDGLVSVSSADVEALARSSTVATLLPGRTFHSGSGCHPPARALIDAGAAVALASGFDPISSPSCSMPMMLSLGCTQMGMTPAEATTAGTINAACAMECDARAGSLEAGKYGDLLLLGTGDYREAVFRFGMNLVAMVLRRGEVIYPRVEAL